jgi:hypothetical protein
MLTKIPEACGFATQGLKCKKENCLYAHNKEEFESIKAF